MADLIELGIQAFAVAGPILLGILVYNWNEKSKRKDFEREAKYKRRFDSYVMMLTALRTLNDTREIATIVLHPEGIMEEMGKNQEKLNKKGLELANTILLHSTAQSHGIDVGGIDMMKIFEGIFDKGGSSSEVKLKLSEGLLRYNSQLMNKSAHDFEYACSSLKITGAPDRILSFSRNLRDDVLKNKNVDFKNEIGLLEQEIEFDLQSIILKEKAHRSHGS